MAEASRADIGLAGIAHPHVKLQLFAKKYVTTTTKQVVCTHLVRKSQAAVRSALRHLSLSLYSSFLFHPQHPQQLALSKTKETPTTSLSIALMQGHASIHRPKNTGYYQGRDPACAAPRGPARCIQEGRHIRQRKREKNASTCMSWR